MQKKDNKYFVVLNYIEEHHNSKWSKKDAIQWAREMAQQGHVAQVYSGELIQEFYVKIQVINVTRNQSNSRRSEE